MTIKQQINHGAIQKVCHLHIDIFHSTHLCHTLSILLYHLLCIIKNNKLCNERKGDFFDKAVEL